MKAHVYDDGPNIKEKRLIVSTNQMQQNRFTEFVASTIQGIKCPIKLHMYLMQISHAD